MAVAITMMIPVEDSLVMIPPRASHANHHEKRASVINRIVLSELNLQLREKGKSTHTHMTVPVIKLVVMMKLSHMADGKRRTRGKVVHETVVCPNLLELLAGRSSFFAWPLIKKQLDSRRIIGRPPSGALSICCCWFFCD